DFTVYAEAFFSSAKCRRYSARASSMFNHGTHTAHTRHTSSVSSVSSVVLNTGARHVGALARVRLHLLAGLIGQHGGVEPGHVHVRIGRLVAEAIDQPIAAVVVVDIDV